MTFIIKPLEWIDPPQYMNYPVYRAKIYAIHREYVIDKGEPLMYGKFPVKINGRNIKDKFNTLAEAKEWCECNWQAYAKDVIASVVTIK